MLLISKRLMFGFLFLFTITTVNVSATPPGESTQLPVHPSLPLQPVSPHFQNEAPVARFNVVANSPVVATLITFDASGSSDDDGITDYQWTYGDGNSSSGRTTNHAYTLAGNYTVRLTVLDGAGFTSNAEQLLQVGADPEQIVTEAQAARFLTHATFGTTLADIGAVQSMGLEPWIDDQLTREGAPQTNYYFDVPHGYSASNDSGRHEIWWLDAVYGNDQLRNRMAYALSQIFVTSDVTRPLSISQVGMTRYYDLLRQHAFGNYRDLLESVTLNPVMGVFLSMSGNERADEEAGVRPDENYAREILQLFSIGIYRLHQDGTLLLDVNGDPVPNYDEQMVKEFARIFTGWERPGLSSWHQNSENINSPLPMELYPEYHDNGSKLLLFGQRVPANQSPEADLEQALDNIFYHPNVAPFISKQLIQRFVTSTPTPEYVKRIAAVFNANEDGVRGDLGSVLKAILLDQEARYGQTSIEGFGKLREPILRMTHLWRAFGIQPGPQSTHGNLNTQSPGYDNIESVFGQKVLGAPSVFNFYHPDYSPPGPIRKSGLVAPEFGIFTDTNILETTNRISRQVHQYSVDATTSPPFASFLDLSAEAQLAANPDLLLDRLNILLLSGSMSGEMRQILLTHLNSLPDTEAGQLMRARDAINLIMVSPDYLIQE